MVAKRRQCSHRSTITPNKTCSANIYRRIKRRVGPSGKRRSEIHVWQNRNIRHQSDWSKVSLYPSPRFLSKNELAKEGPDSVAPGVITALAPTLDRSLKSDRSLCPVRALRYYFGQDLRPVYLLLDQADCDPML